MSAKRPRVLLLIGALLTLLTACDGSSGSSASSGDTSEDTATPSILDGSSDGSSADPDTRTDAMTPTDATRDADASDVAPATRCVVQADETLSCPFETTARTPEGSFEVREVHWQLPLGEAPEGGWPVVLVFQGSFYSADLSWEAAPGDAWGDYHQTRVIQRLLDTGYAVITPEARYDGSSYWDTNVSPWNGFWEGAPDDLLMRDLFAGIEAGEFGPLDPSMMYAAGVSSGGYMTSRMAVSYPGRFRALAIQSGSYATCGGSFCAVPALPDDHPPTLFLHGSLDTTVPLWTAVLYRDALRDGGFETRLEVDESAGHEWIAAAPDEIVAWFGRY